MTFKNSLILFFIFLATGISGYVGVRNGFYPMAMVNYNFVTAREVRKNYSAAYKYFQNASLVYGLDPERLNSLESQRELKRGVLDKMILDRLIFNELERRISAREFQPIADRKIEQFLENNADTESAAKNLYGLSLVEFMDRVLMPQSYQEILEGRMNLNNEDYSKWLEQAKKDAKVWLLAVDLEWNEGSVKSKK